MEVALQRDDLARKLMLLEVITRLPGRRPLGGQLEVERAAERRLPRHLHVRRAGGRSRNRIVRRWRADAEIIREGIHVEIHLAALARIPKGDSVAARRTRPGRAEAESRLPPLRRRHDKL